MSTVELVGVGALFSPARIAVAGFLAGYSGRTREAYSLDLRQWARWCTEQHLELLGVARAHIELYARWLEETGRPAPRSLGACRQSCRSTGTPSRNVSSTPHPRCTCAARKWTTSPERWVWTVTRLVPCLSLPGSLAAATMR